MRFRVTLVVLAVVGVGASSTGSGVVFAAHRAAGIVVQDIYAPSWSPDGKEIAFGLRGHERGGKSVSEVVRTSGTPGGALHTVLAGKAGAVVWARSRIFVEARKYWYSVRVDGGRRARLAVPYCSPRQGCHRLGYALSPDRRKLAFITGYDDGRGIYLTGIVLALIKGAKWVPLPELTDEENQGNMSIVDEPFEEDTLVGFSPDSSQVVFNRRACRNNGFTIDCGTSTYRAIRLAGGGSFYLERSRAAKGFSRVPYGATDLQWSPDGRWLAFAQDNGDGTSSLCVVPTTGSGKRRSLTTFASPSAGGGLSYAWSPTSQLIAYSSWVSSGSEKLGTVSPDRVRNTDLLHGHPFAPLGDLQWSPDGSRIAFVAQKPGHHEPAHLWVVHPDGQDLAKIR